MDEYKGAFIVLDGVDGSGKGKQTELLVSRLKEEGYDVSVADFPKYGTPSARPLERYLRGEFGTTEEVGSQRASTLFAIDRFDSRNKLLDSLGEGKVLISNRYVSANKGHQLANLYGSQTPEEFLAWVNQFEYGDLDLPIPDTTCFLHMKAEIGQRLVARKDKREYTEGKSHDMLEEDLDHLRRAEQAYLFCVENDISENWRKIVCFEGDNPKTIQDIHEDVYKMAKKTIDDKLSRI